jgi:hypothetical protein
MRRSWPWGETSGKEASGSFLKKRTKKLLKALRGGR